MKMMEDIRPVSYLKANMPSMLSQVNQTHRPVVITQNGEPRAVLQDPESYEKMASAINLMKVLALGEEDFRAGRTIEQSQVFKELKAKINER